jgi:hypothetical protein
MEVDGVKWEATWDSDGNIHYAGVDSEGKSVAGDAPGSVKAAAKEHGAQVSGENIPPEPESPKETEKKPESEEVVEPNSAHSSSEKKSFTSEAMAALKDKYKGLYCTGVDPKSGEIKGKLSDGTEFELTSEEQSSLRNALRKDGFLEKYQGQSSKNISFMDEFTAGWKNMKDAWKDMKQDAQETVDSIKLRIQDVKKGFSLIAQGKFRELGGRVALRLNDNLETMGVLPKRVTDTVNRKIEGKLGIKEGEREHKSYKNAKNWGDVIRVLRGAVRVPVRKVDRLDAQRAVNPAYIQRGQGGR